VEGEAVTCYIVDVSGYQPSFNFSLAVTQGACAFLIKATEGPSGYYRSPSFPGQLSSAQATGVPVAAYHYVRGTDWSSQADNITGYVPASVPLMLDLEAGGDVATTRALAAELRRRGRVVSLIYCPAWWLSANGGLSTNLVATAPLMSSQYPVGGGELVDTYTRAGGDSGAGWSAYGGGTPAVWQYSSTVAIGGYSSIDVSAFRGTKQQLAALIAGVNSGGLCTMEFLVDLSTVQPDGSYTDVARVQGTTLVGSNWGDASAMFRNSTPGSVLIYGMAHALYLDAVAASDAVKAVPAKLDAVVAAIKAIPAGGAPAGNLSVSLTGSLSGTATPAS
jgi:hypothetical protein